ncbi:MAG: hypothetical protein IPP96_17840 [Chitinophagaceae bacterium]|nr:hypothetical protein [Chitinophagaceae bacterium]
MSRKIKAANIKKQMPRSSQYFVVKVNNNSFGYSIYAWMAIYTYNNEYDTSYNRYKGFEDTASAAKTARLVIEKLKRAKYRQQLLYMI